VPDAHALTWADLWKTPDQQGQEAFDAEDHPRASELFEDPLWRAAAEFRSGDFEQSATTLEGLDTPDAHYNRGNALAGAGQISPAIEAYERALEMDPEHEDARYNRDLLLEQPEQNPSDSGDSEGDESQESEDGESPQQSDQESTASDQSDDTQSPSQEQDQAASSEQASAEPAESEELPQGEMPTAEELREWEDEQAAEQWLRRIPQDPGGLLRRKFLYQYQRLGVDQDGNFVWPGDEQQPW
jgi:Ca-activated chloride channel family protein